jgi:hypothetical protein
MPIDAHCPACQAEYNLVDQLAGKRVVCKGCHEAFLVPLPGQDGPRPADGVQTTAPPPVPLPPVLARPIPPLSRPVQRSEPAGRGSARTDRGASGGRLGGGVGAIGLLLFLAIQGIFHFARHDMPIPTPVPHPFNAPVPFHPPQLDFNPGQGVPGFQPPQPWPPAGIQGLPQPRPNPFQPHQPKLNPGWRRQPSPPAQTPKRPAKPK